MYTLFNNDSIPNRGIRQPASFTVLRRRLRQNILNVIRHCRQNSYAVDNTHLIVKLINGLGYTDGMSDAAFLSRCIQRANNLAHANGITTPLRKSDIYTKGFIFENGSQEALVSFRQDLSTTQINNQWKRLEPIQFLKHPNTSLAVNALYNHTTESNDVSVIMIDIVALGMQYKKWMDEQIEMGREFRRTPMQFAFQYPLANALMSYHEIAYMNRLIKLSEGNHVERFDNKWPFMLRDFSNQIDRYLLDRVGVIRDYARTFDHQLQYIAMPITSDLNERLTLPSLPINRQNEWAFIVSRLPVISFVLKNDYHTGNNRNRQDMYVITRSLRQMRSSRSLEHGLGNQLANIFHTFIKDEIDPYLT